MVKPVALAVMRSVLDTPVSSCASKAMPVGAVGAVVSTCRKGRLPRKVLNPLTLPAASCRRAKMPQLPVAPT